MANLPNPLMIIHLVLVVHLYQYVQADVYLHNPRGSNNRLNVARANVRQNRVFDSQVRRIWDVVICIWWYDSGTAYFKTIFFHIRVKTMLLCYTKEFSTSIRKSNNFARNQVLADNCQNTLRHWLKNFYLAPIYNPFIKNSICHFLLSSRQNREIKTFKMYGLATMLRKISFFFLRM